MNQREEAEALYHLCNGIEPHTRVSAFRNPDTADFDPELLYDRISDERLTSLTHGGTPTLGELKMFREIYDEEQLGSERGACLYAIFSVPMQPGTELPAYKVPDSANDEDTWWKLAEENSQFYIASNAPQDFIEPFEFFDGPFKTVDEAVSSISDDMNVDMVW
jgi:hypothetical protein